MITTVLSNSPYADGSVEIDGDRIYCSRITALLLREKIKELREISSRVMVDKYFKEVE